MAGLPVVGEEGQLLGVVTVDAAVAQVAPISWSTLAPMISAELRLIGVQTIPPLDFQCIATQLVVAGNAPDVRNHLVFFREDLRSPESFIEDGPAAK